MYYTRFRVSLIVFLIMIFYFSRRTLGNADVISHIMRGKGCIQKNMNQRKDYCKKISTRRTFSSQIGIQQQPRPQAGYFLRSISFLGIFFFPIVLWESIRYQIWKETERIRKRYVELYPNRSWDEFYGRLDGFKTDEMFADELRPGDILQYSVRLCALSYPTAFSLLIREKNNEREENILSILFHSLVQELRLFNSMINFMCNFVVSEKENAFWSSATVSLGKAKNGADTVLVNDLYYPSWISQSHIDQVLFIKSSDNSKIVIR